MRIVTTMRAGNRTYIHFHPEGEMQAPAGLFDMTLCEWFARASKQRAAFLKEGLDYSIQQEIVNREPDGE
jgi:uncharacterized protein YodC (DUF2158 family)